MPPGARNFPSTGRFAPSPTGPLHFGSLVAAVASYLDALAAGGQWLVRMEDLDREREQPGAAAAILRDLAALGFRWPQPVLLQSQRSQVYRAAFAQLERLGMIYPCACSRKEIVDSATRAGDRTGARYPGTCRQGIPAGRQATSWRVRVPDEAIRFEDRIQGSYSQQLAAATGDFVVKRMASVRGAPPEESFTYQLAVVVDDAAQGVTHVVRGADLLDSTPRQIYLQRLLDLPQPVYAHIPAATDRDGNKLSKQTGAAALDPGAHPQERAGQLLAALRFLGQNPPPGLGLASVDEVWAWAWNHWSLAAVPRAAFVPVD